MAEPKRTPSLSLQLRAASSLLDGKNKTLVGVEPEYIPQNNEHLFRIVYVVEYPPACFNAYKAIDRFQSLLKRNYPLFHLTEFRFYTNSSSQAIYEIEYMTENPVTEEEKHFLLETRKLFLPNGKATIYISKI